MHAGTETGPGENPKSGLAPRPPGAAAKAGRQPPAGGGEDSGVFCERAQMRGREAGGSRPSPELTEACFPQETCVLAGGTAPRTTGQGLPQQVHRAG